MTRLRKEYLYRRSLIGKERDTYEKKKKIREALQGNYLTFFGGVESGSDRDRKF
jgi:hypothetical protein